MKKERLFVLLLNLCNESHYAIAKEVGLSACNLSRLAHCLTHRPQSLEKAAAYFKKRFDFKVAFDAALLTEELGPRELIRVAQYLRDERLKGAAA